MHQAFRLIPCVVLLALAGTGTAFAAEPAPKACTAPAPVPAEFAGFDSPTSQTATAAVDAAPKLALGTAYRLGLLPAPGVSYVAALKKPAESGRFAGFATFAIAKEGLYSIAASEGVWIDVLSGSDLIRSASFGRVECSSLHKIVNFALKPGTYAPQLSNAPAQAVTVMIVAKP